MFLQNLVAQEYTLEKMSLLQIFWQGYALVPSPVIQEHTLLLLGAQSPSECDRIAAKLHCQ